MTHDPHRPSSNATNPNSDSAIGRILARSLTVLSLCALAAPSSAYVGPGAGLGFVGTLFGIVAALVLAMIGLFWYPLKRAFGKKPAVADGDEVEQDDDARH